MKEENKMRAKYIKDGEKIRLAREVIREAEEEGCRFYLSKSVFGYKITSCYELKKKTEEAYQLTINYTICSKKDEYHKDLGRFIAYQKYRDSNLQNLTITLKRDLNKINLGYLITFLIYFDVAIKALCNDFSVPQELRKCFYVLLAKNDKGN